MLGVLLCDCLDSGHLVKGSAPALAQYFSGTQPGIRAGPGPWEACREPNRLHLSSQHTELGMAHFCDILVTTRSCEDDGCHPNHYRAVFQWLQTQSKAKDTQFLVCVNRTITARGMGTALFNQLPWLSSAGLFRCAWLCIQARRAGRTCMAQAGA